MIGQNVLYSRPKEAPVAKLSLISLMDIFTILVFFLMLNSGETHDIETAKVISLPDSIAGKSPHAALKIFVSKDHIIFNRNEIADIAPIREDPSAPITALEDILTQHIEKLGDIAIQQEKIGHAITIMADKNVNYEILKSVMETCRDKNFRNISLAVNRIASSASSLILETNTSTGTEIGTGLVEVNTPRAEGGQ
jgi:biopolymer transport protein ExbD